MARVSRFGKWLDLLERVVWSHEVAHLQMFVAWLRLAVWWSQKRLMQSFFGISPMASAVPRFGVPLRGGGLLLAQRGCWWAYQCGGIRVPGGHTLWRYWSPWWAYLVAVLESLVVVQVMAMAVEPWCAPSADVQTLCLELDLHKDEPALMGKWWAGPGLILFVDGAHDGLV